MEVSILSRFWKEIFPNMFNLNQTGDLNVLVLFLSLENNKEFLCFKATLNR